jgi:hypothetical protein
MKSPRELLLERHQAMDAKLDTLRCQILQVEVQGAPSPARTPVPWWVVVWHELVRPCQRVWVGLATAWVVIATLQALSGGPTPPRTVRHALAPSPEVMALLQEQRRLRSELLGPSAPQPAATPTRSGSPRSDVPPLRGSACRRIEIILV